MLLKGEVAACPGARVVCPDLGGLVPVTVLRQVRPPALNSAEILAALPIRPRPGLRIEPLAGSDCEFVVLEDSSDDPGDSGADAIVDLAVTGVLGGWYLGCITCNGEIAEADAGMCHGCREDV